MARDAPSFLEAPETSRARASAKSRKAALGPCSSGLVRETREKWRVTRSPATSTVFTARKSCFHRGFDGLRRIEIHHALERLELDSCSLKRRFDHASRSGALLAHQQR